MAKNEVMSLLLQAEMDLDDVRELTDEELATVSGGIATAGRLGVVTAASNSGCGNSGCNGGCGRVLE
jgi:lactobin A/cerein 7B family class IIb bacteriocin